MSVCYECCLCILSDHLCCVFLQINQTALHEAARHGSYNITSTLIRSGANVNAITKVS